MLTRLKPASVGSALKRPVAEYTAPTSTLTSSGKLPCGIWARSADELNVVRHFGRLDGKALGPERQAVFCSLGCDG